MLEIKNIRVVVGGGHGGGRVFAEGLRRRFVSANLCNGGESGESGGRSSQKGYGKKRVATPEVQLLEYAG